MDCSRKFTMALALMAVQFAIFVDRNKVTGENEICHPDTIEQTKKLLKELTGSDIIFYFTLLDKTLEAKVSSADLDEAKMVLQCSSGNNNRQLKRIQIPENAGLKMRVDGKLGVSIDCNEQAPKVNDRNLAVSLKITLKASGSSVQIKPHVEISGWQELRSASKKECQCGDGATVVESAKENRIRFAAAYGKFVAKEFLRLSLSILQTINDEKKSANPADVQQSCSAEFTAMMMKKLSRTSKLLVKQSDVFADCNVAASVDLAGLGVDDFDFTCEKGSKRLVEMKSKRNRPIKFAFSGRFCHGCLYRYQETQSPDISSSNPMQMLALFAYTRGKDASFEAFRWSVADVSFCYNELKMLGDLFQVKLRKLSDDIAEKLKGLVEKFA